MDSIRRPPVQWGMRRYLPILAVVAVLAAFSGALGNGFISWDDDAHVTDNPVVRRGLSLEGARWAFTSVGYTANWYPLTWLSHQLDAELFGLSPAGHHATSVLLHLLTVLALGFWLAAVTGSRAAAWLAALLFGLHPLRVESVAWVAERKDVLSGLLFVLTLAAWVWHLRRPGIGRHALAMLAFALALMAKQSAVTLPLVLLLLDFWPLGRLRIGGLPAGRGPGIGRVLLEKAPLLALAAGVSLITLRAQAAGGSRGFLEPLPLASRLGSAAVWYVSYLGKTLWPAGLAIFYPNTAGDLNRAAVAGATILLGGVTVLVVRQARRFPWLATGWLWFLGVLAPMSGLVQFGAQGMADRYTYLPHIGLFLGLAASLPEVISRRPAFRVPLAAIAAGIIVCLAAVTIRQTTLWRDDRTLFEHAVAVTRGNWMARNLLGNALVDEGDLAGAEGHYRLALEARRSYAKARYNLAYVLQRQGRLTEAADEDLLVIAGDPFYVEAFNNLGTIRFLQGRIDEAADLFERATRMKPDYRDAWGNLALARTRQGRLDEAAEARLLANRP